MTAASVTGKTAGGRGDQSYEKQNMGVVLKVLVKEGPLGIHFLKKEIPTYIMAILGTGILNNYYIKTLVLRNVMPCQPELLNTAPKSPTPNPAP